MKYLFLLLFLFSTTAFGGNAHTVRFVYYIPSDVSPNSPYVTELEQVAVEVQEWMKEKLGKTYRLASPAVVVARGKFSSQELLQRSHRYWPESPKLQWYSNVMEDVEVALNIKKGLQGARSKIIHIIYADFERPLHQVSGSGGNGFAIVPRQDLEGIMDRDPQWRRSRWIGGITHELFHAFGIAHPEACTNGSAPAVCNDYLMHLGYVKFPESTIDPVALDLLKNGKTEFSANFLGDEDKEEGPRWWAFWKKI